MISRMLKTLIQGCR